MEVVLLEAHEGAIVVMDLPGAVEVVQ